MNFSEAPIPLNTFDTLLLSEGNSFLNADSFIRLPCLIVLSFFIQETTMLKWRASSINRINNFQSFLFACFYKFRITNNNVVNFVF